jgi:hypothetical protein
MIRLPGEDEGVDVGIPQTGDQVAPRAVDNGYTTGIGSRVGVPDLGDPIPLDNHGRLGTRRRSRGIDESDVGDRDCHLWHSRLRQCSQ